LSGLPNIIGEELSGCIDEAEWDFVL